MPICLPLMIVGLDRQRRADRLRAARREHGSEVFEADPLSGMKRIVSMRGLVELAKSILKIAVRRRLIAWSVVAGYLTEFPSLVRLDLGRHLGVHPHGRLQDHPLRHPGAPRAGGARLRLPALAARGKPQDDQAGNQGRAQANRGRPAGQGPDPFAPAPGGLSAA